MCNRLRAVLCALGRSPQAPKTAPKRPKPPQDAQKRLRPLQAVNHCLQPTLHRYRYTIEGDRLAGLALASDRGDPGGRRRPGRDSAKRLLS
eukprot:9125493-Alexandrium_andersonii.AAC.1